MKCKRTSIKLNLSGSKILISIIAAILLIVLSYQTVSSDISKVNEFKEGIVEEINNTEPIISDSSNSKESSGPKTLTEFTYKSVPEYNSDAFVYVNDNEPFFTNQEIEYYKTGAITYGVDGFNRPRSICMLVSKDTLSTEDRSDISDIYPPGWNQAEYEGVVEGDWIYNRCHLIAHCLGGADSAENLITGTRYLNIDGMWQLEETVLNYVKEYDDPVLYRVTPIYNGTELVARGVLMEAYSTDSNELRFCVYCYNVQPGISIDYRTGETNLIME